jgi:hypothetical protein
MFYNDFRIVKVNLAFEILKMCLLNEITSEEPFKFHFC